MIYELMDDTTSLSLVTKLLPFLIYKNFFFIKYFNVNFFISNNSINLLQNFTKSIITIKKNKKKLLNYLLFFKRNFISRKFISKSQFRFNRFLFLIALKKSHKSPSKVLKTCLLKPNLFFSKFFFAKNWFYLVGGMLPPHLRNFQSRKKIGEKVIIYVKKKYSIKSSFFTKKIYLYNFFYFSRIRKSIKSKTFSFKLNKKSYNNRLKRPIGIKLFFNSPYYLNETYAYPKKFTIILYKNYKKIFRSFKRNNFRYKKWNNFWFQKFSPRKKFYTFSKNFFRRSKGFNAPKKPKKKLYTSFIEILNPSNLTRLTNRIVYPRGIFIRKQRISSFKRKKSAKFKLFALKSLKFAAFNSPFIFFTKKARRIYNNLILNFSIIPKTTGIFSLVKGTRNRIVPFKFNRKDRSRFKVSLLRYVYFMTKNITNLTLYNYSFLYLTSNFYKKNLIYEIKKNLYSFLYKNEIEKMITRKYLKSNFIYNLSTKNNFFSSTLKQYHPNKNLTNTLNNAKSNYLNWSSFDGALEGYNDFSVKRIRFKPGYMNIWRNARNVFKRIFNISFKYQHRLTNFFLKFTKFARFKTFLISEMSLENILLKSRIVLDLQTSNLFIRNGLIFINGLICYNKSFQLFTGDFVQLILNIKYYIMFRWLLNWSLKNKIKLKNKFFSRINSSRGNDEKQRSFSFSKWILQHKNVLSDVSKYLEVDYFTLSIFILYEPFLWNDLNTYSNYSFRYNVINLYNWKYIT